MAFLPTLSPESLQHYTRVVAHSVDVRSHFDVLVWLQGDMQRYLPHDIMIAAWGDFATGQLQYDIISTLDGVRSKSTDAVALTPTLQKLFVRWTGYGKSLFTLNIGEDGFLLERSDLPCALVTALQTMRCAMVHGINDERGNHNCLYITFSTQDHFSEAERSAMAMILPYIDTALRRVDHLPHQSNQSPAPIANAASALGARFLKEHDLSDREVEILQWIALGKTNPEIGSILEISAFTVKNHLQRIFKKLNVSSRAQAVSQLNKLTQHV